MTAAKDKTIKSDAAEAERKGDHWAEDLEGSYRDAKDKPDPTSIMQEQEVPEGWPGS